MFRLGPLALAALLVGGCRPAADADHTGSPGDSVAGTETKQDRPSSEKPTEFTPEKNSGLANSLIAVTATSASEAGQCERMCGSLGDCLLADDAYTTAGAGSLELQCLDICVHSPEAEPAKTTFLACGSQTQCGQLVDCAEQNWDALAATRRSPEVGGIVASGDTCVLACDWIWACLFTNAPPGEIALDPVYEQYKGECANSCQQDSPQNREVMSQWYTCLQDNCSQDGYSRCGSSISY
jgi:hypothetical protein